MLYALVRSCYFNLSDKLICTMSATDDWGKSILSENLAWESSVSPDRKNCSGVTKTVVLWQKLSYARLEVVWLCYVHPALSNRSPLKKALWPFWYRLWLPLRFLPHQNQLQWCICIWKKKMPVVYKQCEMHYEMKQYTICKWSISMAWV